MDDSTWVNISNKPGSVSADKPWLTNSKVIRRKSRGLRFASWSWQHPPGGIAALTEMLADLTGVFPAAIAIVQHRAPRALSVLARILNRSSALPVTDAKDGELIRLGRAYLAPADYHVSVNADATFSLTQSERVHGTRPAPEILFESVAKSMKERVIAVVLSGAADDGENGVRIVKEMGGRVIAQDEETSEFFSMPSAAVRTGAVDFILPLASIAPKLLSMAGK